MKWILRLSVVVNILFISVFIIIGLNYVTINSSSEPSYEAGDNLVKSDFKWPEGKEMALSFTFDDARFSQVDNGIPLFDKYGVKATFYVSIWNLEKRLDEWKKAIGNGHEIGNHSYRHPCTVNYNFTEGTALEEYTISRMRIDLYSENELIKGMLGVQAVSFAYPCGQTYIGKGLKTKSYVPLISEMFESGRGWLDEGPNDPAFCDMSQLTGMELDGKSFEEIKTIIETAKKTGKWLILAGHEINEAGDMTSELAVIESICQYAADPANGIWVNNVHNIAAYVKEQRGEAPFVQMPYYKNPVVFFFSKLWSKYHISKMK